MAEYYDGNGRERVSKIVNEWAEEQIFSGNEFLADIRLMREKFLRNVALGVSVENQLAEWRIEHLRYIPAAIRFLSCEPLVGPLSIKRYLPDLDWVRSAAHTSELQSLMRNSYAIFCLQRQKIN